jgi:hypothetical protein
MLDRSVTLPLVLNFAQRREPTDFRIGFGIAEG